MSHTFKTDFSAAASGKRENTTPMIRRFNPYDFDDKQILRQSTGHEPLVKRILQTIKSNLEQRQPPNQHLMVVGNRGMGKSFLVRRIQLEVTHLTKEGAPLVFVRLPEEQLNISTPELLLDEICRILKGTPAASVRVKWKSGDEQAWHQSVAALRSEIARQPGFTDGAGLLVISVENFDVLLNDVFDNESAQSRLRELLAEEPRIMLLTTSTTPADNKHNKRLFHAFRREQLPGWEPDEFVEFYRKTFVGDLTDSGEDKGVEAKIRALAHFTGGAPRLAVLIGDVFHSSDALSIVQVLNQLADELTPYFQDRILTRLKSKSRWLLDELLRGGEPCSQSELARRVGANGQAEIAQPFMILLREGIVVDRRHKGKSGQYQVTDRIFAHFYRNRYLAVDSHSPLENMLEFLESFYSQREQAEQAVKLAKAGKMDEARVFAEALRHGQDIWGKVNEGERIRDARRIINLLRVCPDTELNDDFLKVLSGLIDQLGAKTAVELMQNVSAITKLVQTEQEKIFAAMAEAAVLLTLPDNETAIKHINNAVAISQNINHIPLIQLSLYALALTEASIGRRHDAEKIFEKLLAQEISCDQLYEWGVNGQMWNLAGLDEFDKASAYFERVITEARTQQSPNLMARLYRQLSYVKHKQSDDKAGLEAVEMAKKLCLHSDDYVLVSLVMIGLAWCLRHFKHYDEALEAAQTGRRAADRAGDKFLMLDALSSELYSLKSASQYKAVIENAPAVIALADQLKDIEQESRAQLWLAETYQLVEKVDKASETFRTAAETSLHSENIDFVSGIHQALIKHLEELEEDSSTEILNHALNWGGRWAAKVTSSDSKYRFSYPPLDMLARAATLSNSWPKLIDWLAQTPLYLDRVPGNTLEVGKTVVNVLQDDGVGPAFSVIAGFLRALAESFARDTENRALNSCLKKIYSATCTEIVRQLPHPDLLRDIADELRHSLKADDIAELLEAAALYREQDKDAGALDSVDPDIRKTIIEVLAENNSDKKHLKQLTATKEKYLYERDDQLVSDTERKQIADQIRQQDKQEDNPWATLPLYPGNWSVPSADRATELVVAALGSARKYNETHEEDTIAQLSGAADGFGIVAARALCHAVAVREIEPTFYPGWRLAEIALRGATIENATFSFLLRDESITPVLGNSPPIHNLNSQNALVLSSKMSVTDYMNFFCHSVWGDDGPFRIINSIDQIPVADTLPKQQADEIGPLIAKPEIISDGEDAWTSKALVNYGKGLFLAELKVQSSGMVEMLSDEHVMGLENVKRVKITSGLQFFDGVYL